MLKIRREIEVSNLNSELTFWICVNDRAEIDLGEKWSSDNHDDSRR